MASEYKFYLNTVEVEEPSQWDGVQLTLRRSDEYSGLEWTFSDTLEFIGVGAAILRAAYEAADIDAVVNIVIEDCIAGSPSIMYDGVINFAVYKEINNCPDDCSESITVGIMKSGLTQKFKNRIDIPISLSKSTGIDGNVLTNLGPIDLGLHSKLIEKQSRFSINPLLLRQTYEIVNVDNATPYLAVPFQVDYGDVDTSMESTGFLGINGVYTNPILYTGFIYPPGTTLRTIRVYGRLKVTVSCTAWPPGGARFFVHLVAQTVQTNVQIYFLPQILSGSSFFISVTDVPQTVDISFDYTLLLPPDCNLFFSTLFQSSIPSVQTYIFDKATHLNLVEESLFPSSSAKSYLVHEAFYRIAEAITGVNDCFRSDFFGGPGSIVPYDANGCGHFLALTNGLNIRQFQSPHFIISGSPTSGSVVITSTNTDKAKAGDLVSGNGVPAGAYIVSVITNTSITISALATISATNIPIVITVTFFYVTGNTFNGNKEITTTNTNDVNPGDLISGPGIPDGAYVVSVVTNTSFTISIAATADATGVVFTLKPPNFYPVYSSFKALFDALDTIYCLGMRIEIEDGREIIRVESRSYFYKPEVSYALKHVAEIERTVALNLIYNEAEFGYQKWETDQKGESQAKNGIDEFNSHRNYSLPIIQNKQKLSNICAFVAGGHAIELTRRLQFSSNPTSDSAYDNENFLIACNLTEVTSSLYTNPSIATTYPAGTVSERNENFINVVNIISPETAYNLRLSPARMVCNWYPILATSMVKKINPAIKFQSGTGNYRMLAERNDDCDESNAILNEGQDILSSDVVARLRNPYFLPELYTFSFPISLRVFLQMKNKANQAIAFGCESVIKGYIKEIQYSPNADNGIAVFKLIKAFEE